MTSNQLLCPTNKSRCLRQSRCALKVSRPVRSIAMKPLAFNFFQRSKGNSRSENIRALPVYEKNSSLVGAEANSLIQLERKGRSDWDGFHMPLLMSLFPAYLLGTFAEVSGFPGPSWVPALSGAGIGVLFAVLNRFCKVRLWVGPKVPINVLITGGSKGIGKALAREFLSEGDCVIITSRTQKAADKAVQELREDVGPNVQIYGVACDVSDAEDVSSLQKYIKSTFKTLDVWINNAGCSASFQAFTSASQEQLEQVVSTNLLGVMLCAQQAINLFEGQPTGGHLFNMDGAGADGLPTPQYAAYGATKAGITQFTRTLQMELEDSKVCVHTLSPGMVLTDLLLEKASLRSKQIFNILCEHPETVAAFLVPRIRSTVARGESDKYIRFLSTPSILYRFLTAPTRLNRFFDGEGNAVYPDEKERMRGKYSKATARLHSKLRQQNQGLQLAYSLSIVLGVVIMLAESSAFAQS